MLATESLLDFTTYTWPGYKVNWHHEVVAKKLTEFAHGKIPRLMIFMPVRHGKTELSTRRLAAFLVGQNPDAQVLVGCHTAKLAAKFNGEIQRIMDHEAYNRLFPETRLRQGGDTGNWSRTQDLLEIVGHRGHIKFAGVGNAIAGIGGQFGIIDDPIRGVEDADSPVMREKAWDWFWNDFQTRIEGDGPIVITQTRWHRDDVAGRLLAGMESGEGEHWDVLCIPAIRGVEPNSYDPRNEGEPLWPERISLERLMAIKSQNRRTYEALYQQNPTPDGGTEWPGSFFDGPDVWFDDWPGQPMLRTTGIDPSKGSKAKAGDYSAIVKCMVGPDMRLYIEADMDRRHVDAIVDRIIEIQRTFRPDAQAIEVNGFQEWVADRTERVGDEQACFVPIIRLDNKDNKDARIRRLTPYLSMRKVRFKRNSPGTTLLVNQLRDFPNGEHDDGPDALEMAVRIAVDMVMGGEDRGIQVAGSLAGGW